MTEVVEHNFPSTSAASTDARQFLRSTLQTWALDGFGEVTELLTGELVSNVVRHVGSPITVRAIRHPSRVRVEVDDASSECPVVRDSPAVGGSSIEYGGWGMRLVDALAN